MALHMGLGFWKKEKGKGKKAKGKGKGAFGIWSCLYNRFLYFFLQLFSSFLSIVSILDCTVFIYKKNLKKREEYRNWPYILNILYDKNIYNKFLSSKIYNYTKYFCQYIWYHIYNQITNKNTRSDYRLIITNKPHHIFARVFKLYFQ